MTNKFDIKISVIKDCVILKINIFFIKRIKIILMIFFLNLPSFVFSFSFFPSLINFEYQQLLSFCSSCSRLRFLVCFCKSVQIPFRFAKTIKSFLSFLSLQQYTWHSMSVFWRCLSLAIVIRCSLLFCQSSCDSALKQRS